VLDAKGQQTNFQYNIDNTLNNVSYTTGAGSPLSPATPTVSFTYDTAYVRALTMVDGVGATQYTYNAEHRLSRLLPTNLIQGASTYTFRGPSP
jgi:hypothetical protein